MRREGRMEGGRDGGLRRKERGREGRRDEER